MTLFDLLHENAVADLALLNLKDSEGDLFSLTRDVDFAFKTPTEENARDLAEFINGKNFGAASIREDGEHRIFWVLVVISMPITQHVVNCVSAFMLCLSRLFLVDYDGWGSVTLSKDKLAGS